MNKKQLLAINLFFLFFIFFIGKQLDNDAFETIAGFMVLFTFINLFDAIFDKFKLILMQIITYIISALALLQLFIIIL